MAYQHVSETPVPPSEVNPTVPRALDAVVLRALAKDPFQRYQDSATFREALDATVDGRSPSKRQVGALTSELYGPNPRQAAETARSLRQLSTDTTMKRTQAGPPVAWIWTGVALLAVLLISVLFWVVTIRPGATEPSNARTVPDVAGLTYEEANTLLAEQDLLAYRVDETNPDIEEGRVIRTDPEAEATVNVGQEVRVYVSEGAELAEVPPLTGLSQDDATSALEDAGLSVGQISRQNDPSLRAGIVISADPPEGTELELGTVVNLVVASGRVLIDDYTGFTLDGATRALEADDIQLTVEAIEDPSCPATDPPTVIQQSIPPGEAPVHATIQLTVCSGAP